jgi:hypothetical protein
MAAPSSVSRSLLDPFLRGVIFWLLRAWTRSWQIRQINSATLKTYWALNRHLSTGVVMETVPMTISVDGWRSIALWMKFEIDTRPCVVQHKACPTTAVTLRDRHNFGYCTFVEFLYRPNNQIWGHFFYLSGFDWYHIFVYASFKIRIKLSELYHARYIEVLSFNPAVKKAIILLSYHTLVKVLKDAVAHLDPYQNLTRVWYSDPGGQNTVRLPATIQI